MSNHIHLVLRDDASELSTFMCRFEGPLAKGLNKLDETRGQVFERRFTGIKAIDRDAVLDCVAYAAMNPVEAGLVRTNQDWPGLLVWPGQEQDLAFGREGPNHKPESHELRLARDLLTPEENEWLRAEVERRTAEVHRERGGLPVLGLRRILAQNVFEAPEHPKRSNMPICHASCLEHWWAYLKEHELFREAYRVASRAFRAGDRGVRFPEFSFRPWTPTFPSIS